MATRRDELSAHTFARKRTLAAFLQPESRVSDEDAPRPFRAIMPSVVLSVVLVVACIAWGVISPSAPPGWDETGQYVIVDTDSTTRYVVLPEEGKNGSRNKQLHPVLNFASARLVLDKGKGEVIEVSGQDIDEGGVPRGATIGIPYAPDRLPSPEDAGGAKEWAVCEKPGADSGGEPQQAVFVLGGQDEDALRDRYRLNDGQAQYVEDSKTGERYVVDAEGTRLRLDGGENDANRNLLTKLVLRDPGAPQKVSTQWLETLNGGEDIRFPTLDVTPGTPPGFSGAEELPEEAQAVGTVLKYTAAGTDYYYVVRQDRLQYTTPLVAKLFMGGSQLQQRDPVAITPLQAASAGATEEQDSGGKRWPDDVLEPVNRDAQGVDDAARTVSCSIYTGDISGQGRPVLATWSGPEYPAKVVAGSARAYVSPGSGLLFREVSGRGGGGRKYLLTDSGLRYALAGEAGARLGYEKAKVVRVPQNWSAMLPKGPTLSKDSASQEQGL
ncbi:type VII secretion protein EccB [Streptomyces sp. TR02-1]|uniref:type VII secretion protein EccB n=1 Tax=Streptomyces sp. TR02-1 TaxID=3385977 RepID=UPI0039A2D569